MDADERRARDRERKKRARAAENPEQSEKRTAKNRDNMALKRVGKTSPERDIGLSKDRQRKKQALEAETHEQTIERTSINKQQTSQARAAEAPEKTTRRTSKNRQQTTQARAAETPEKTTRRTSKNRQQTTQARAAETPEKTTRRTSKNRQQTTQARASETAEQTTERMSKDRQQTAQARMAETPEKTTRRTSKNRQQTTQARAAETPEKMKQRTSKNRQQTTQARAAETAEQTTERTSKDRQQTAQARAAETPEQTTARKSKVQKKTKQNRDALKSSHIVDVTNIFQLKVKNGPTYACTVCQRLLYHKSVVKCCSDKYTRLSVELKDKIFNSMTDTDSQATQLLWVCLTCHNTLKKGELPAQAVANGLYLETVPEELKCLHPLELRLISQRIPFMKMVGLPRGQQKAIYGPAINIPTNLDHVCSLLPRLPNNAEILPMKLKRKLVYKGHYLYDYIRPQKVISALMWLKENNSYYKDITICHDWEKQWSENSDLWEALINIPTADGDSTQPMDTEDVLATVNGDSTHPIDDVPGTTSQSISADDVHTTFNVGSIQHSVVPISTGYDIGRLADRYGFIVCDVPGDGNCCFTALSLGLCNAGIQSLPAEMLRRDVVQYFRSSENTSRYQEFVSGPDTLTSSISSLSLSVEQNRRHGHDVECPEEVDFTISMIPDNVIRQRERWNRYVNRLEEGAWADNVTIQGLADMLLIEINIISTLNPDNITVIKPFTAHSTNHTTPLPIVHIGLIEQHHYVALEPHSSDSSYAIIKHDVIQSEDAEDQEAFEEIAKNRGLPYDTCLQPEDPLDAEDVYCLAPGENQKPRAFLTDDNFEILANPDKYPHGEHGYTTTRSKRLTPRKYFNQRILNADGRFAKDIEYLLAAQYVVESKQVRDDSYIALRQTRGMMFQGKRVTAGLLRQSKNLNAMMRNDSAIKFLKNVRGSPAYWQRVLYDVMAMVRQLGIPTWFLTLSAADMQWPEIIQSIARQYGKNFTDEDVAVMSWDEKCNWLRKNSVTAARQFQYRLDTFFNDFLCSNAKPSGEIVDYFIRIEFQARGSPHAHTIIWVKDAPKINVNPDEVICKFVDKYQCCEINDHSAKFQSHKHSATCRRNGACRFRFPHAPSIKTLIARPVDETTPDNADPIASARVLKQKQDTLRNVKECLIKCDTPADISTEDLLLKANVSVESYTEALSTSNSGTHIILKREPRSKWINSFNADILHAWKANMDLQYIIDPYSCIMYVTSYMMKSERAMSELLRKVAKEARSEDVISQLRKLGTTFLNNREVSAQEAAYRLLSLPLKKCSRQVIFVNTSPKENRVSMLKPTAVLQDMDEGDEDIFCKCLTDKYAARPDEHEDMCLAEFAVVFTSDNRKDSLDHDDNHDESNDVKDRMRCERITLKHDLGKMYRRQKEAIIRFHKEKEAGESKFRNLLMLYCPWSDEDAIKGDFLSYEARYNVVQNTVIENQAKYTHHADVIDRALDDLDEFGPSEHAWDMLAPGAEEQQAEQRNQGVQDQSHMHPDDLHNNPDLFQRVDSTDRNAELHARYSSEASKTLMSPSEYRGMMRSFEF